MNAEGNNNDVSLDGSRILVVDDTPENLQIVGETLTRHLDCDLSFAMNGRQALEIALKNLPELILLDVVMPEMDGLEACRKLKENPETSGIPVLFLTARTEICDIISGFKAGAVDYVTKPFHSSELLARVQTHLRLRRANNMIAQRNRELEDKLAQIHVLEGFIPICAYCKKIRDDEGYWQQLEKYITEHSQAKFSHGMCPDCYARENESLETDIP